MTKQKKNKIILVCNTCYGRNYSQNTKINSLKSIELKKYCKTCKKHEIHTAN